MLFCSGLNMPIEEGGRAGVPLGGLGTGSVEITLNRTFGRVRLTGREEEPLYAWPAECRGDEQMDQGIPGCLAAVWTEEEGGVVLCGDGVNHGLTEKRDEIAFEPGFPLSSFRYVPTEDLEIGLVLAGSLGLAMAAGGSELDGLMPGFLALFFAENRSERPRDVAFCLSWRNMTGQMDRFPNAGSLAMPMKDDKISLEGILQTCHTDHVDRDHPEFALALLRRHGDVVTRCLTWDPNRDRDGFFADFSRDGRLDFEGVGDASALCVRLKVAPHGFSCRPFALAWSSPFIYPLLNGHRGAKPRYLSLFGGADEVAMRLLIRAEEMRLGEKRPMTPWSWMLEGNRCALSEVFLFGSLTPLVRNTFLPKERALVVRESAYQIPPLEAEAKDLVPSWRPWVALFPETMGEWIEHQARQANCQGNTGWADLGLAQREAWTRGTVPSLTGLDEVWNVLADEIPFFDERSVQAWALDSLGAREVSFRDAGPIRELWEERVLPFAGLPMDDPLDPYKSRPDLWISLFVTQAMLNGGMDEGWTLLSRLVEGKNLHDGPFGGSRLYGGRQRVLPLGDRESATTAAVWGPIWSLSECAWISQRARLVLCPRWSVGAVEDREAWSVPLLTPFLKGRISLEKVSNRVEILLGELWRSSQGPLEIREIELRSPRLGMRYHVPLEMWVNGEPVSSVAPREERGSLCVEGMWFLGDRDREIRIVASVDLERGQSDPAMGTLLSMPRKVESSEGTFSGALRVNCGGETLNREDLVWERDRPYELSSWGYVGGCSARATETYQIPGEDSATLATLRTGTFSYLIHVPSGEYRIKVCLPPATMHGGEKRVHVHVNRRRISYERPGMGFWIISQPVFFETDGDPMVISFEAHQGIGALLVERNTPAPGISQGRKVID